MKLTRILGTALFAVGLVGCGGGGGGGGGDVPQGPPPQAAEIIAPVPLMETDGLRYRCPSGDKVCKFSFEVSVTGTTVGGTPTSVEIRNRGTDSVVATHKYPATGTATTFKVDPHEVQPGAEMEYRIDVGAGEAYNVRKFESWTGDTLIAPKVTEVPRAEIIADPLPWRTQGGFQYKCPAGSGACQLQSFTVSVTGTKPGTSTSVKIFRAGSETLLEEHTVPSQGGDSSFTVEPRLTVEAGTSVTYKILSESTSIRASQFVSRTGDVIVRPRITS